MKNLYINAPLQKDLGLRDENRELVLKGTLKRKGTSSDSSDMLLFLLDHCLLITKLKYIHNTERYKLYRKVCMSVVRYSKR